MDSTVVLIASASIIALLSLASAVFLYGRIKRFIDHRLSEQQAALVQYMGHVASINDIANLVDALGQVKEDQRVLAREVHKIDTGFRDIEQKMTQMRNYLAYQKSVYDSTAETIDILERKLVGSKSRGDFGEDIVKEKLNVLGDWIEYKAPFSHDREVEFALRLPNGRIVPIDSKWTATNMLNEYGQTKDETAKKKIRDDIKKEVGKRALETRKYLENHRTIGFCIAAVPDIVFDLSHDIQGALIKLDVVLISYSLLVPYLLMLIKTVVSHEQADRLLKTDHVLKRTKLQIEKIQEYVDRKIITAFDALKAQQAQQYVHNYQIQQATERIRNIRDELETLHTQFPGHIIGNEDGKLLAIPQDIHQQVRAIYESLLDIHLEHGEDTPGSVS